MASTVTNFLTELRRAADNSGLAKVAVQCSVLQFFVNLEGVLRINSCGGNRHLRQAAIVARYYLWTMKLYLTDQADGFSKLLADLIGEPTMTFDKGKLTEKVSTIHIATEKNLKQTNLDFLFDYKIFPSNIMTFKTQWGQERRKMKVGDTILQQATIPPTKFLSQKIIFGVRINNIIDEDERRGFSYETIEGHVEKGESTFTIEQSGQELIFKVKTFSEPGNLLTKLVGPIFTVPYQTYCTRRALENVKKQILQGGNSAQQQL